MSVSDQWGNFMNFLYGTGTLKSANAQSNPGYVPPVGATQVTPGPAPAPNNQGLFGKPTPGVGWEQQNAINYQAGIQRAQANAAKLGVSPTVLNGYGPTSPAQEAKGQYYGGPEAILAAPNKPLRKSK